MNNFTRRRMLLLVAALLFIFLMVLPTGTVHADPPDMYSQNFSISIMSSGFQMDWKILPGPLLADAIWQATDQNSDGTISQAEADAWVAPFISEMTVTMDGQPVKFSASQDVHWPATVNVLRTGEDSVETTISIQWPANLTGKHSFSIHSAHLESNSLNWFSLTSQNGLVFAQPKQTNGRLEFDLYFPSSVNATPDSSLLTAWNSGTPNLPGFTSSLANVATGLTNSNQSTQPVNGQTSIAQTLTGLVKAQQFSPLFLLGAFLLSLLLGSLHALTPGHGKALVGAYLVGSQGRTRDAVFLGTVVTITHTGSVLLLGLITLFASHYILPSLIAPWLDLISGLLVIGFGINLLIQRRRDFAAARASNFGGNRFAIQTASPARGMDLLQPREHSHSLDEHIHTHSHGGHEHSHELPNNRVTWKSLLTLGISGGLVPCPDAIAILLVAVAVNRIPFGMLLIVAFSIGLALVLIGIGIAMVQGVQLISRSDILTRFSLYTPILSAVVVSGLGVALTISALNSFKVSSAISNPSSAQANNVPSQTPAPAVFDVQHAQLFYLATNGQSQIQLFKKSLAGGDPLQVTNESSGVLGYVVSPDRSQILYTGFSKQGGSAMWLMNADGSGSRLVLDCGQSECYDPEWYPGSQRLAYDHMDFQNAALSIFSVWWLDLETGKTYPVFQDQNFPSFSPKFSSNGQWLSYISPATTTLQIYGLQSGKSVSLPLRQSSMQQLWRPNGDSLLYWEPVSPQASSTLHAEVYSLASGQSVDLGGSENQSDDAAAWSPDGEWVAIDRYTTSSDSSNSQNEILLVKPDGSGSRVLLSESDASYADLSWSPDGRYLVYTRYSFQGASQSEVWLLDVQSGEKKILAENGMLPKLLP